VRRFSCGTKGIGIMTDYLKAGEGEQKRRVKFRPVYADTTDQWRLRTPEPYDEYGAGVFVGTSCGCRSGPAIPPEMLWRRWEDSPSRYERKEKVPQPLRASFSLWNTWLLPGVLES